MSGQADHDAPTHIVTCVSCRKGVEGFAPEQAHGCAADITDGRQLVGHYGSTTIDMEVWLVDGSPLDLPDGQICDDCIEALIAAGRIRPTAPGDIPQPDLGDGDEDAVPAVTCVSCRAVFEGFAPDQAHGCAADITDGRQLVGHYGSTAIDMEIWQVEGSPLDLPDGQICDACIAALIQSGRLHRQQTVAAL